MKKISLLTVIGVFVFLLSLFAVPALAAESESEAVAASEEYVLTPGLYKFNGVSFMGEYLELELNFRSYVGYGFYDFTKISLWQTSYAFMDYVTSDGTYHQAYSGDENYTGWVGWHPQSGELISDHDSPQYIEIHEKQTVSADTYNFIKGNCELLYNYLSAGSYKLKNQIVDNYGLFDENNRVSFKFLYYSGNVEYECKYLTFYDCNVSGHDGYKVLEFEYYDTEIADYRTCYSQCNYYKSHSDIATIYVPGFCNVEPEFYNWFMENVEIPEELEYTYDYDYDVYYVSGIGTITDTDITVPEYYRGQRVGGVYQYAFDNNTNIKSINFDGNNMEIRHHAFEGCSALSYVDFDSISNIGMTAFSGCTSLTEVDLSSIEFLEYAFMGCTSLHTVTLSDTLESLPGSAFANTAISSVDLPVTINKIGASCFDGCTSLASVNFAGDIEQKEAIDIKSGNDLLLSAKWTYKYALYRFYKYNSTAIEELSLRVLSSSTVSLNFGTLPFTVTVSDGQSVTYTGDDNFVGLSFSAEGDITYLEEPYVFAGTELPKVSVYLYDENLDFLYSSTHDAYYVSGIGRYKKPNVIIPDTYNGKRVIGIYEYAFSNVTTITSVELPAYCSVIQSYAFYGCTGLQTINFEAMLSGSTIGRAAFSKCTSLVSGDLTSIDYIGRDTFRYCSSLSSVTFSKSLVSLDEYCFSDSGIVDLIIPASLSEIPGGAFEDCENLKSLYLPNISKVNLYAFDECNSLSTVFFEGDYLQAEEIVEKNGNDELLAADWTYEYVYYYFYDYKGTELTELTLRAYYKDSVTINFDKTPLTVTYGYQTLTYNGIDYQIAGFANAAQGAVTYVDGTYTVKGSTNAREDFYFYADILDFVYSNTHGGYLVAGIGYYESADIIVPAEYKGLPVVGINDTAFLNDTNVRTVLLPIGCKYIGKSAFRGCTGLVSVNFEAMIDGELNNSSFSGCKALYKADLTNVKKIGNSAFYDCLALSEVKLSNTLSSIGSYAFHCCFALKNVTLPDTIKTIPQYCFYNTGLEHVELGQVTLIEQYAFNNCGSLKTVFYRGDYKQADKISISNNNEPLESAVWSYQYVLYNFYDYKGRSLEGLSLRVLYTDTVTLHFDEEPFRVCVNGSKSYTENTKFVGFSDRKLGDVFDVTGVYTFEGLSENYIDLYLANDGYRNDIILDEFNNSSSDFMDKSDQLQNDLGSLQKPDINDVNSGIDNVLNEDVTANIEDASSSLSSIFDSSLVTGMILISLSFCFVAYIFFGKAK